MKQIWIWFRNASRSLTSRCGLDWRDDSGGQMVEIALVSSFVLLPLMMGLVSMGRAFSVYETVNRAAREGARVAAVNSCAECGNALPAVSDVENAVLNTMTAASVKTSSITIPSPCSGNLSSKICYQRDITLNLGDTDQELGVVVALTYPIPVNVPFTSIKATTINITRHVQMREEN